MLICLRSGARFLATKNFIFSWIMTGLHHRGSPGSEESGALFGNTSIPPISYISPLNVTPILFISLKQQRCKTSCSATESHGGGSRSGARGKSQGKLWNSKLNNFILVINCKTINNYYARFWIIVHSYFGESMKCLKYEASLPFLLRWKYSIEPSSHIPLDF